MLGNGTLKVCSDSRGLLLVAHPVLLLTFWCWISIPSALLPSKHYHHLDSSATMLLLHKVAAFHLGRLPAFYMLLLQDQQIFRAQHCHIKKLRSTFIL
jgi:hypothetical protein